MTEIRAILPADLEDWIKSRLAEGGYPDPGEYLLDLIRRDQLGQGWGEQGDSPEYVTWVRERVAEAEESPLIDRDPRDAIKDIIAERRARRG